MRTSRFEPAAVYYLRTNLSVAEAEFIVHLRVNFKHKFDKRDDLPKISSDR